MLAPKIASPLPTSTEGKAVPHGPAGIPINWGTSGDAMDKDALRPYLDLELWSLREAAYLLCGWEPRTEADFIREDRDGAGAVAQAYRRLKDATLVGTLRFVDADGAFMRRRVRPADAQAWAELTGIKFSDPHPDVQSTAEDVAARQAQGFYTVQEAAEELAEHRANTRPDEWVRDMREANDRRELVIRSYGTKMPLSARATRRDFRDLVKVVELDAWLRASVGYGFPSAADTDPHEVPTAAPETPKQRRTRLLEMLDAEIAAGRERGALARITETEKRTRPTADRSNIGKDIKKARQERSEERRGGVLARMLG